MPPPMSPQGSRAGLITAVVVLSILFVPSAIFAFYYNAEYRRAEGTTKTLTQTNQQFATSEFQQSPAFTEVMEMRTADPSKSVAEILVDQRDAANRALAGTTVVATATAKYQQALTSATDKPVADAGIKVTKGSSLADAVDQLTKGVAELAANNESLNEQLAAAQEKYKQEVDQRKVVLAERDEKLTEQGQQLAAALTQLSERGEAGDQSVAKIQAEADRALKVAQQDLSKRQKELADRDARISKLQKDLEAALIKIRQMRPEGTNGGVIRQADGRIVRVPGNDNVYIDLGQGEQISPGLTFEVYDRFKGVPAPGEDAATNTPDTELVQGKASIEVVRVGPGQSECRIIRQTKGQSVIEGDIIANLVYNRDTKFNFCVFGDFDLDQNKIATPGDAEVIRRLITQWGGQLQKEVNVNTDFVVLGMEPEVPVQDDEESATDIARREAAQKALEDYLEVRSNALKLNIPVLNQNRFLYYVGYYEQAQR